MCKVGGIVFAAALVAASGAAGAFIGAAPARAENCPGNPDALGTSRVLVVDPAAYSRVGSLQYKETLPLADKEVVITFDDGPLPSSSNKILDILASQCVKVTYFIVGSMAHSYPDVVQREYEAGHTIGTHSQDHPLRFEKLVGDKLNYEIDAGIASVSAALGDPSHLAPFFRIPGLGRSEADEAALAERSLVVFSVDVVADDWHRHITPAQIIQKAMSRLEKRGSGILLLHDIHPTTAAALPGLLKELKDHGFHVVHVVPPPSASLAIAAAAKAWTVSLATPQAIVDGRPAAAPSWPQSPPVAAAEDVALAAPDAVAFNPEDVFAPDNGVAENDGTSVEWPSFGEAAMPSAAAELPAPGLQDIGVSMRGEKFVGAEPRPALGLRPSLGIPATTYRGRPNGMRVHMRRPAPTRPAAAGQHADLLSGLRSFTALLTPTSALPR